MNFKNRICTFFLVSTLIACSGGGGSGGDSSDNGRPETGIRVIHASIDSTPLELTASSGQTLSAKFGESSGYTSLPSEPITLNLGVANLSQEVIFSDFVTFEGGSVHSLLVYGSNSSTGLQQNYLDDALPEITADQAVVRVVHGAVGASAIAASVGGSLISDEIAFGSASRYVAVTPGPLLVRARRAADGAVLLSSTFTFEAGKAYSVVVSGEAGYLVASELLVDN